MKWYKKQLKEILQKNDHDKTESASPVHSVKTKKHFGSENSIKRFKSPVKQRNNNRNKTDCK